MLSHQKKDCLIERKGPFDQDGIGTSQLTDFQHAIITAHQKVQIVRSCAGDPTMKLCWVEDDIELLEESLFSVHVERVNSSKIKRDFKPFTRWNTSTCLHFWAAWHLPETALICSGAFASEKMTILKPSKIFVQHHEREKYHKMPPSRCICIFRTQMIWEILSYCYGNGGLVPKSKSFHKFPM